MPKENQFPTEYQLTSDHWLDDLSETDRRRAEQSYLAIEAPGEPKKEYDADNVYTRVDLDANYLRAREFETHTKAIDVLTEVLGRAFEITDDADGSELERLVHEVWSLKLQYQMLREEIPYAI